LRPEAKAGEVVVLWAGLVVVWVGVGAVAKVGVMVVV